MSLFSIFDISSSGMTAQTIRMNTIASNMANANSQNGDKNKVYRAKLPVFQSVFNEMNPDDRASVGVRVTQIVNSQEEFKKVFDPGNPLASKEGFVYKTNVNGVEEMTNMISASRTFQNNIEVMNAAKQMLTSLLRMGQR